MSADMLDCESDELSLLEAKMIRFVAAAIRPDDVSMPVVNIYPAEVIGWFGLNKTGGYAKIRSALIGLQRKRIWWKDDKGREVSCSWMPAFERDRPEDGIQVTLSPQLSRFFLGLKEKKGISFYSVKNILQFDCKYSLPLFELLYRFKRSKRAEFSLECIREKLGAVDIYPRYNNFTARVLSPAIKEINEKTDLYIRVTKRTFRRTVKDLIFELGRNLKNDPIVSNPRHSKFLQDAINHVVYAPEMKTGLMRLGVKENDAARIAAVFFGREEEFKTVCKRIKEADDRKRREQDEKGLRAVGIGKGLPEYATITFMRAADRLAAAQSDFVKQGATKTPRRPEKPAEAPIGGNNGPSAKGSGFDANKWKELRERANRLNQKRGADE